MNYMKKQYIGKVKYEDKFGNINPLSGVFINKKDEVMCMIKALNAGINDDCRDKEISVFALSLSKVGFYDDKSLTESQRTDALRNFLKNKMFIFNLFRNYHDDDNNEYFSVDNNNFSIIEVPEEIINNYDVYETVPIINVDNKSDFDKQLMSGNQVISDGFLCLNRSDDVPFVIVHGNSDKVTDNIGYIYSYLDIKGISPEFKSAIFKEPTKDNPINVRKIEMNHLKNGILFNDNKDVAFIPNVFLMEDNNDNDYCIDSFSTLEYKIDSSKLNELDERTDYNLNSEKSTKIKEDLKDYDDVDSRLIKQFKKVIATDEYRLVIDDDDLVNIHTSIKSNLLTVLSGISGTGKSRVIKAYSDALGIHNDNNRFKFISVRPFWQDDSDLLGFVDNMSNNYHPGDTGLIETIQMANNDSENIYLITLDEMNLARVEHYFSQFLSVLERDPDSRYINLYNPRLERRLYNSEKYPSKIFIPKNIRFVGTMNVDDSTFEFSDKLLDRANIINLKMQKFTSRDDIRDHESIKDLRQSDDYEVFNYDLYIHNNGFSFNETELNMLWELNEAINNVNPNQGVSWRTVNSIESFISKLPDYYTDINHVFDTQLSSRIFTKLRGTSNMLSSMFYKDENDNLSGSIVKILNNHPSISDFSVSKKTLLNKIKELSINGFAR